MAWIDLGRKKKREALSALNGPVAQAAPRLLTLEVDENATTSVESASLGRLARLQPFSPVAISLMRQLDQEDSDFKAVARLIGSDTALAAETLAVANSPLFGMHQDVKDLIQALTVLGTDRMRSLATTLAMRSFLKSAPKPAVVRRLWRHSIATAAIASELAPVYGVDPALANTAGVLHDVGRMGLLSAYRDDYPRLVIGMYDSVKDILLAERDLCGLDHCDAGIYLSNAWKLPKIFELVTGEHHRVKGAAGILGLISVSCQLADELSFAAIMYRGAQLPPERIAENVPEELRLKFKQQWKIVEERIADKVTALDF